MSNFYQDTEQALSHLPNYGSNETENNKITPEKTLEQLKALLLPLNKIEEGYAEQALAYLLTGNDNSVIAKLTAINDKQYNEARSNRHYEINLAVRTRLYSFGNEKYVLSKSLFEKLHDKQIVRLGKFLSSMTKLPHFAEFDVMIPLWFIHLVDDCVILQHTSLQRLMDLLTFANVPNSKEIITQMILEKRADTRKSRQNTFVFSKIDETADFDDFFAENIELFELYSTKLTKQGETDFFTTLLNTHPHLLKLSHKIIATLCVSEHEESRVLALDKLTEFKPEQTHPHLQTILQTGKAKQKKLAIDALMSMGDSCLPILEQAFTTEKIKSVQKNLQQAIQLLTTLQSSTQDAYKIPEFQPLEISQIPDSFIEVMKQNADEIYKERKQEYERLVAEEADSYYIKKAKDKVKNTEAMLQNIDSACENVLKDLNGESNLAYSYIATHNNSVQKLPEYSLLQAMVLSDLSYSYSWRSLEPYVTTAMLEGLELRHFQQVLKIFKLKKDFGDRDIVRDIADDYLEKDYYRENSYPFFTTEQVVPFFMTYPELIAEALGLAPIKHQHNYTFDKALNVLSLFPQIPDQYIPKLLEVALGTQKSLRFECQQVLAKVPNIHLQAIEALADSKADIRVTAVEWLGRLGNLEGLSHQSDIRQDIIQALHGLMKKEKKEAVTTAILSALEQNDDDISVFLTPEILLKEAQKGLKGKVSKTFAWFDITSLPTVNWQDGTPVDSEIIQWWAILAEKLKQPSPNELFQRYVSLLEDSGQKTLSLFMLQSFINQDLDLYSLVEAEEIADTIIPSLSYEMSEYGCIFPNDYGIKDTWSKQYPDMPCVSEELMRPYVIAQLQKTAKGSAIKSKGLLALAHKATGSAVLELLNNYIKNHHRRTHQIGALIDAFSASDEPLIIQWILSISRRYRTKSIQQKAVDSINETAKRNHWTQHQLADRTIPMAGVDDEGILTLDYDSRNLTAYIDEKYKFVLHNENGKVIKSLPAPRKEDDTKIIKEAKSIFSASKKELKQMIELQTARLYEAMCSERMWAKGEWLEYLFAHPIMKRLVARLIWLEVDTEGKIVQAFRPCDDGNLLNIDDDEITLATDNHVKLAHKVLLTPEETTDVNKAWKQHLKDYEIKPLFSQLDNMPPQYDDEAVEFDDFRGYLTTAYKLRSAVTKLGYQRGVIGDGGGFKDYVKTYDIGGIDSLGKSQGLVVTMNFGGGDMSEEDIDTVLLTLTFTRKGDSSWQPKLIPLAEIPPILLAESYAEYAKVAKSTGGFDPDWKNKSYYY